MEKNVERAFWTQGPGGVGQSLNTDLIANTFGSNHSFVDVNIYLTPDEFRKQAEVFIRKCVVTARKFPLYEKRMTGEPIACRPNCPVLARLIRFIGWKQFEMNQSLTFQGVPEETFPFHDDADFSPLTEGPLRTCGRAHQDVLPWERRRFTWVFPVGQRVEGPKGLVLL